MIITKSESASLIEIQSLKIKDISRGIFENTDLVSSSNSRGSSSLETENIAILKSQEPTSINQELKAYYTLNEDHIFSFEAQHLSQDEDPFYNAIVDLLPFDGIIPVDQDQDRFNINQEKNIKTQKLDAKVDYYYVINKKSNII